MLTQIRPPCPFHPLPHCLHSPRQMPTWVSMHPFTFSHRISEVSAGVCMKDTQTVPLSPSYPNREDPDQYPLGAPWLCTLDNTLPASIALEGNHTRHPSLCPVRPNTGTCPSNTHLASSQSKLGTCTLPMRPPYTRTILQDREKQPLWLIHRIKHKKWKKKMRQRNILQTTE